MRLDACDLDGVDFVSIAPFERNSPEEEWVNANNDGVIPPPLYDLYQKANFLSFGKAPRFLSDPENLLFSYYALVLRSIHESLVDAHIQADSFSDAHQLVYDPMKKLRGEKWEKGADKRERRHFRDLLIALQTALDSLADTLAIFFPGALKGLEVGRARFSRIEPWLSKPLVPTGLIATPTEFYLGKLHEAIGPLVCAEPPETDWLPLMRLLRNKAAHLGQPFLRQVGLPRTGDGKLFVFIPRQWPYLWEQQIKPAGQTPPRPFPQMARETLMHQDIVTYTRGLLAKVKAVIAEACGVLAETYGQFKDLPENQAALLQLKSNFESYPFEHFTNV